MGSIEIALNLQVLRSLVASPALLAGDASVDSRFREIHVPRACSVYLATGFNFREKTEKNLKNRAGLGLIGVPTLASIPHLLPYY